MKIFFKKQTLSPCHRTLKVTLCFFPLQPQLQSGHQRSCGEQTLHNNPCWLRCLLCVHREREPICFFLYKFVFFCIGQPWRQTKLKQTNSAMVQIHVRHREQFSGPMIFTFSPSRVTYVFHPYFARIPGLNNTNAFKLSDNRGKYFDLKWGGSKGVSLETRKRERPSDKTNPCHKNPLQVTLRNSPQKETKLMEKILKTKKLCLCDWKCDRLQHTVITAGRMTECGLRLPCR